MASNFDFLEEWPKLQAATKRAESYVHNDPETSQIGRAVRPSS